MKLLNAVSALILSILATIAIGYGFATTWSWFVVPVFDVPVLTTKQGVGLMLQAGWLMGSLTMAIEFARAKYDRYEDSKPMFRPASLLLATPIALLIDYLYYLYL